MLGFDASVISGVVKFIKPEFNLTKLQLLFPWELSVLGNALTFLLFGIFAVIGFILIWKIVPETKGKSLEELEELLVK